MGVSARAGGLIKAERKAANTREVTMIRDDGGGLKHLSSDTGENLYTLHQNHDASSQLRSLKVGLPAGSKEKVTPRTSVEGWRRPCGSYSR